MMAAVGNAGLGPEYAKNAAAKRAAVAKSKVEKGNKAYWKSYGASMISKSVKPAVAAYRKASDASWADDDPKLLAKTMKERENLQNLRGAYDREVTRNKLNAKPLPQSMFPDTQYNLTPESNRLMRRTQTTGKKK